MNKIIALGSLLLLMTLSVFDLSAQKIVKETINGQEINVYPFRVGINYHNSYFMALKKMRPNRLAINDWYTAFYGKNYDKSTYKMYMKQLKSRNVKRELKSTKYMRTKKFKALILANPYKMVQARYSMDKDIVPVLDKVPDGRYVQYFDTFLLILPDGTTEKVGNRIAGYFNLKNNMLEGEAVWFNPAGDTVKTGHFTNGLKEGNWALTNYRTDGRISEKLAKEYIAKGSIDMDTTRETFQYVNGTKSGKYVYYSNSDYPISEGYYKDNKQVGEWIFRDIRYEGLGSKRKRIRNNNVITLRYTLADSDTIVKRPMIRYTLFRDYEYMESPFDFEAKFEPSLNLNKFYNIAYPKEVDLELEEEKIDTYDGSGEYYPEEEMYFEDEEYYGEEEEYYEGDVIYGRRKYDYKKGEYVSYAKLIDSLGINFSYTGVYEKYYPNGKLMVRYDFSNGNLKSEDTIFWDNGRPYDVIVYNEDSAHFEQTVYDYTGTLYKRLIFDSIGEFKRVDFEPEKVKFVQIGNLLAEDRDDGNYFFYDKVDTLAFELKDSLILFRSWYKKDTSMLYNRTYHPQERRLNYHFESVTGIKPLETEIVFGEDFLSWTGRTEYLIGDLKVDTKSSASFMPFYEPDSIPQRHVDQYEEYFEIGNDKSLYRKGTPYTGKFTVNFSTSKFDLKTSSSNIKIDLPRAYSNKMKLQKDVENYRKKGHAKNEVLLGVIDASEIDEDFGASIYSNLIGGFVGRYVEYPYNDYYLEFEEEERLSRKDKITGTRKVQGSFLGGKPHGNWKVFDHNGKVVTEIPYFNGEINGTVKQYEYAQPRGEDYYRRTYDTLPQKEVFYLRMTTEYKNGIQQGKNILYNWLGQVMMEENYLDGAKHGPAFERNSFAHTNLSYEYGNLDGYVRTKLTLPNQDSLLLFELNFQDGLLQGESRSYHTNGKLAKKGFFLNGEPIDDYEAFDSLGVKYHYVKFQYSYPVEEKIWEENELSVRYMFDWRDSIRFRPDDITSTQSLERMLYRMGIGSDQLNKPYYGRPSLINKNGITYHMTKYYPNDTVARDGSLTDGKKAGCWKFYSYEGEKLYEVDYFDTILTINDSVQFKSKGILTDFNSKGQKISESYIIEKFEKYDCSHTDHYELRQLYTIWQAHDSLNLMNGYVKNYYDNGVLMNEGMMKNGLPTGVWKYYDPFGKLNQVGEYILGKRNGRWLAGDLSKTKYLGDICLNPNLPNLEEEIKYREKLLDIVITNYKMGKALNKEFYDVNLNNFEDEEASDVDEIEESGEEVEEMEEGE